MYSYTSTYYIGKTQLVSSRPLLRLRYSRPILEPLSPKHQVAVNKADPNQATDRNIFCVGTIVSVITEEFLPLCIRSTVPEYSYYINSKILMY